MQINLNKCTICNEIALINLTNLQTILWSSESFEAFSESSENFEEMVHLYFHRCQQRVAFSFRRKKQIHITEVQNQFLSKYHSPNIFRHL